MRSRESEVSSGERWYLLLLVPFVALSVLPLFNRVEPRLVGIPFFWWYQFLWVPLSAGLTAVVYMLSEKSGKGGSDEP
jgi:hypothetical protein